MKTEEFRLAGKLTIVSVVKNAMLASPLTSLCNEGCQAGWSVSCCSGSKESGWLANQLTSLCNEGCQAGWSVSCCSGSKECHAGWPIS